MYSYLARSKILIYASQTEWQNIQFDVDAHCPDSMASVTNWASGMAYVDLITQSGYACLDHT